MEIQTDLTIPPGDQMKDNTVLSDQPTHSDLSMRFPCKEKSRNLFQRYRENLHILLSQAQPMK